ncbi:MAG: UPF0109 protein [Candidatus Hydrogenedentota bacterium]
MAEGKEMIELIAKKLVDHPEDVQVREIDSDEGRVLELRVHPEDMGKVIGKEGRTAKAIRTLLSSAAAKANIRADLKIVE